MAQPATIPFHRSPLRAEFQHLGSSDFTSLCRAYDRLWQEEGIWPRIEFPIPRPLRALAPRMFVCLSWSLGARLMEEGIVDEHDLRALQPLVPRGTRHRLLQLVMLANNGFLSRWLTSHGVPFQYPHLAQLADYFSFTMPPGQKHDAMRAVYAAPVKAETMRRWNYEAALTSGAGGYLDSLAVREQWLPTDVATAVGRGTVVAAMAGLLGVSTSLLNSIINLARGMDNLTILRPSHRQLQEAEDTLARACALLEQAVERGEISRDGVLGREYGRLVEAGPYSREQWAYIATMLVRVSMENQIDSLNLVLRRFAGLRPEEKAGLRSRDAVRRFVHATLLIDPPVGFIIRKLPRTYTFDTPVAGKRLSLPAGSHVLFVPRLLQSPAISDNCRDYLLSFGYGRNQVCPGRGLGLLTVEVCAREILVERNWDIELSGAPRLLADNAFFRRIVSAPGQVRVAAQ